MTTEPATEAPRPIAVGDYVRWTSPTHSSAWADGVVTRRYSSSERGSLVHEAAFDVELSSVGDWTGRQNQPKIGETVTIARHALRRIPRPAAAQATVPVFPAGADRTQPCPTCSRSWGEHFGIACHGDDGGKPCPACGDRFSDHYYRGLCHGPVPTSPSVPALVDGLTPDECLQRYTLNMQRADDSLPWPLTPLQRCAAQALWAHDVRAKVAARTAADKARLPSVVVERQDEP